MSRQTPIKTVGLCHSVQHTTEDQHTTEELANDLGLPVSEIDYLAAGINHMAFYLKFEHQGQSLYPRLMELASSDQVPQGNREHIYHAAMLDPHTAAELNLDQIWVLTDDLLTQHGDFVPQALQAAD